MRRIRKNAAPQWFEDWKTAFLKDNGREATYKQDFAKDKTRTYRLRKSLMKEQGYICCYCMGRITEGMRDLHNEHFWPQNYFPKRDMDYSNLFASCGGNPDPLYADYCGHRKNDWYSDEMMIPTDPAIESMFEYRLDGTVAAKAASPYKKIAQEMIENFGLNSYHLVRNRKTAIQESELFDELGDYDSDDFRYFMDYYDQMHNGEYIPYCQAIIDCMQREVDG